MTLCHEPSATKPVPLRAAQRIRRTLFELPAPNAYRQQPLMWRAKAKSAVDRSVSLPGVRLVHVAQMGAVTRCRHRGCGGSRGGSRGRSGFVADGSSWTSGLKSEAQRQAPSIHACIVNMTAWSKSTGSPCQRSRDRISGGSAPLHSTRRRGLAPRWELEDLRRACGLGHVGAELADDAHRLLDEIAVGGEHPL